jgi:hypothetical protein
MNLGAIRASQAGTVSQDVATEGHEITCDFDVPLWVGKNGAKRYSCQQTVQGGYYDELGNIFPIYINVPPKPQDGRKLPIIIHFPAGSAKGPIKSNRLNQFVIMPFDTYGISCDGKFKSAFTGLGYRLAPVQKVAQQYTLRRVYAALQWLINKYSWADPSDVTTIGSSMGGQGSHNVFMSEHPEAYGVGIGAVGGFSYRQIIELRGRNRRSGECKWGPDSGENRAFYNSIDPFWHLENNPAYLDSCIIHKWGYKDGYAPWETVWPYINATENARMCVWYTWHGAHHTGSEKGLKMPKWPPKEMTFRTDQPVLAFSNSTGNWPRRQEERETAKRGHVNLGLSWHGKGIIDTEKMLIFPIRYQRFTDFGLDVPNMPEDITVNITLRRKRKFELNANEWIHWMYKDQQGVVVQADSSGEVTIEGVRMHSGDPYLPLRLSK